MVNKKLEKVIEQVAKQYNTTPQEIRVAMQASLDDAMSTTDPAAKAKWNAIPRKGNVVTLEEFFEYAATHHRN